ncbi:MAG: sigma-70 family RNA polymerase sigma factor [Marinicella sp.]
MTTSNTLPIYNVIHGNQNEAQDIAMNEEALRHNLDGFLQLQQSKSYAIAMMNTRQESDAFDIVQEAMMSFVVAYKHKPQTEWKPLYYRILQNKINDHHRKNKSWLRYFFSGKENDDYTEQQPSHDPSPLNSYKTQQQGNEMIEIIRQLPQQQKQVVIYRHWQELSVKDTAQIMQISEGSVKTHLSRATIKIKQQLGTSDE